MLTTGTKLSHGTLRAQLNPRDDGTDREDGAGDVRDYVRHRPRVEHERDAHARRARLAEPESQHLVDGRRRVPDQNLRARQRLVRLEVLVHAWLGRAAR